MRGHFRGGALAALLAGFITQSAVAADERPESSCTATPKPYTRIVYTEDPDGGIVLTARINGREVHLLLDLTSSNAMLSRDLLGLPKVDPKTAQQNASSSFTPLLDAHPVDTVDIGDVHLKNVQFVPYDGPPVHGLDGTITLEEVSRGDFEIDPGTHTLSSYGLRRCDKTEIFWPHGDQVVLPMARETFKGTVPVELDGKVLSASIDSAATDSFMPLRVAERVYGIAGPAAGQKPAVSVEMDGATREAFRHDFHWFAFGDIVGTSPSVLIGNDRFRDFPVERFHAPRDRNFHDLVIGSKELRGLHLYFAWLEFKLYVTTVAADARAAGKAPPTGLPTNLTTMAALHPAFTTTESEAVANAQKDLLADEIDFGLVEINTAIKHLQPSAPLYVNLSALHGHLQDLTMAIAAADTAVATDPSSAAAYRARGWLYANSSEQGKALPDLDKAIALDPKSASAFSARCLARSRVGTLQDALADCDQAIALAPNSATGFEVRGLVHYRAKQYPEAIADYQKALDLDADSTRALYGRGLAKQAGGDATAGAADMEAASKRDGNIAKRYGYFL